MKLRKLMFVLPNLFTCTSIFCGFYALTLCAGDATPAQLYQASIAIIFAMFFDGFDGRVARLTKTQSQFGVELDSLADVVSFGVVPAMLVYKWALSALGFVGIFIAFAFAACGALRLARFNVLAQRPHPGGMRYFVGLPIPLAAGVVVSMVIAHHVGQGGALPASADGPVAGLVVALSLLMVSTVRYRTFKDLRLSPRSATVFMLFCAAGVVISIKLHPAFVPAVFFSVYLAIGLVESAVMLARKVATAGAGAAAGGGAVEREEEDELAEDEEEEDSGEDVDEQDYL